MDKSQCLALMGKQVLFGSGNTRFVGTIIKVNPTRCKIRQDGPEGGASWTWNVSFAIIYPINGNGAELVDNVGDNMPTDLQNVSKDAPVTDYWLQQNKDIIHLLDDIFGGLSPENLACDGEATEYYIGQTRMKLERQLRGLTLYLNRNVNEEEVSQWVEKLEKMDPNSSVPKMPFKK